jgi:integrase
VVLGRLLKMAKRWGVIEVDRAADLEKPSEPTYKVRYLGHDEWLRLRAKAEPWLVPILTMAVVTGMRLKEAAGLTWENIDQAAGLLFVSEDNKTGKPRAIPMTATVRDVLAGQVRRLTTPYLFTDAMGNAYTTARQRNRISQRTVAAAKAAELAGVSFHTLRHTAGSWRAQAGHSSKEIAGVLGHSNSATTDKYMHLTPEHLRAPVQALDSMLREGHISVTSRQPRNRGRRPANATPSVGVG